jgi:hypothetical protein
VFAYGLPLKVVGVSFVRFRAAFNLKKEGQKKTLDKFEIIKLETIRTQLTNIKTNCKLVISDMNTKL